MTEEELVAMAQAGEDFWREFSALCEKYIGMAPEPLKAEWTAFLGDKTSIYGRRKNR